MSTRRSPRPGAWLLAVVVATALPAGAQEILDIETPDGDIRLEFAEHPVVDPFVALFRLNAGKLEGAVFHESDKDLQCTPATCSCPGDYECMPMTCSGADPDPFLQCDDDDEAECACDDASDPTFVCTPELGADLACADASPPTCTCEDASVPEFACRDGSEPPGSCTEPLVQTDVTQPSATLHFGLHRLVDGEIVDVPDYIPGDPQFQAPGIFENARNTVAFVRDSMGVLTSEVVINVADNADVFDDKENGGADAYMVFARVIAGSDVVDSLSRLATIDPATEVPDALSCSPPPAPLPSWVEGIPDPTRCGWEQLPLLDASGEPPRINGSCPPGDDVECRFPTCDDPGMDGGCDDPACPEIFDDGGTPRCTAPLLPECLEVGDPVDDVTPCLDPVCADTFLDADMIARCTEPLGRNFPILLPEPRGALLALAALAALATLRARRLPD